MMFDYGTLSVLEQLKEHVVEMRRNVNDVDWFTKVDLWKKKKK